MTPEHPRKILQPTTQEKEKEVDKLKVNSNETQCTFFIILWLPPRVKVKAVRGALESLRVLEIIMEGGAEDNQKM